MDSCRSAFPLACDSSADTASLLSILLGVTSVLLAIGTALIVYRVARRSDALLGLAAVLQGAAFITSATSAPLTAPRASAQVTD